jgi:acyl-homoserine lactone synthase
MLLVVDHRNRVRQHAVLRSMFAARKRIFIDLLKWDLPVLAGQYEVDQFDDVHASYLIVADAHDNHLASARLLPTTRPALLDSLFADLIAAELPQGPQVLEITRFCLSREAGARLRREARDALLVGLVEFALANQIQTYTGVAELAWFEQIQGFGWACHALGEPRGTGKQALVALRIDIDETTLGRLAAAGIGPAAEDGITRAWAA